LRVGDEAVDDEGLAGVVAVVVVDGLRKLTTDEPVASVDELHLHSAGQQILAGY